MEAQDGGTPTRVAPPERNSGGKKRGGPPKIRASAQQMTVLLYRVDAFRVKYQDVWKASAMSLAQQSVALIEEINPGTSELKRISLAQLAKVFTPTDELRLDPVTPAHLRDIYSQELIPLVDGYTLITNYLTYWTNEFDRGGVDVAHWRLTAERLAKQDIVLQEE